MKKYWPLLLFAILALFMMRPVLGPVWYPVHDTTSVARAYLLQKSLASGQIPAVWAGELDNGAGYPLFHFYAPAFTYLSLLGKVLTTSYFAGIKLVLILTAISGMTGMYLLTRRWGRSAGLVAAISYGLLPYAAINLYVRGAYAEYLSMSLLPWVFYFWSSLTLRRHALWAGISTALFILSHNLIPLMTAPFLIAWILLNHPGKLKVMVLPTLLTLGLCAFFLAPLVFERNFVQADTIAKTTDYTKHFVTPSQLWNSPWGFGGSAPGLEDGMSFKIGKIQLLLAALASLVIIFKRQKKLLFVVIAGLAAMYMTTDYSSWFYQHLPYVSLIQFPWRFLVLVGFFVCLLAGYAVTLFKHNLLRAMVSLVVVLALIFVNLKLFAPQTTFSADQNRYTSREYVASIPSIVPEYAPSWLKGASPTPLNATILPYYYYPTWQVTLDNRRVNTYASVDGYLAFDNPTHSTNYQAIQGHTLLENVASLISLATLLFAIKLYVKA